LGAYQVKSPVFSCCTLISSVEEITILHTSLLFGSFSGQVLFILGKIFDVFLMTPSVLEVIILHISLLFGSFSGKVLLILGKRLHVPLTASLIQGSHYFAYISSFWQFFWTGLASLGTRTTGDTIKVASVKFCQAIKNRLRLSSIIFHFIPLHFCQIDQIRSH